MRALLLAVSGALLLAGCASVPDLPAAATPIPAGKAQLVIRRSNDLTYAYVEAEIEVNGARIAALSRGQSVSTAVAPGAVNVAAVSAFGRFNFPTDVVAGREYRFLVSARMAPGVATALGGVIGMAIESAANEGTGGAFDVALDH